MKVLLVHNRYKQAGGEDITFSNCKFLLQKNGHDVVIYERDNYEIEGYDPLQKAGLAVKTIWANDTYKAVCQLIAEEQPHIAHVVNFFPLISPAVYYACQKYQLPVVQELPNYRLLCPAATFMRNGRICTDCLAKIPWRGVIHRCYRESWTQTAATTFMLSTHRWLKTWQNLVTAYIVRTEFSRSLFVTGGIPAHKIKIKPNFVLNDPGLRAVHENFALYIGRLSPEKGVGTLFQAWEHWADQPLYIVGDGPAYHALTKLESGLNLTGIKFLGTKPHEEALAMLKKAQFLIVPSEWYEPFGYVVIEAFACGVPVIAANSGALGDIVEDGVTGVLFEPGNIVDLQAKIAWAFAHPEEMARLAENGRKQYETTYTAEANYQHLIQIYNTILS